MNLKKILLIVVILLFPNYVYAKTLYGNYIEVVKNEDIKNDLNNIVEVKKYNTFKYDYVDMGYLEENELYIKDDNDFIYEERKSDIYDENSVQNILINTNFDSISYYYLRLLPKTLKIYEMEVFYKGEKINYSINGKDAYNLNNINDNDLDTYYQHEDKNYSLSIELNNTYLLKDLEIVFYADSDKYEDIGIYIQENLRLSISNNNTNKYIIFFNKVFSSSYVDYYYLEKVRLNKYYKEEKIIENKYVETGDNLILDDYIIDYRYFKRGKVVLEDNIIIKDKLSNIEDFIIFKTDDVRYLCDINLNQNGKYYCDFYVGDKVFKEEILVDINRSKVLDNDVEIKENLSGQGEKINNDILVEQKSNIKGKNCKLIKNKTINKNNGTKENIELDDNKNNNYVLENEINKSKTVIVEDKNKRLINFIKKMVCLILIVIIICLIIKRKRYNVESI